MSEPNLRAFLLADYVAELKDGKFVVGGIYDVIGTKFFPTTHNSKAFMVLGNVPPKATIMIHLGDSKGFQLWTAPAMFFEAPAGVEFNGSVQFNLTLEGMPLLGPGEHFFEVYVNQVRVGTATVEVQAAQKALEIVR